MCLSSLINNKAHYFVKKSCSPDRFRPVYHQHLFPSLPCHQQMTFYQGITRSLAHTIHLSNLRRARKSLPKDLTKQNTQGACASHRSKPKCDKACKNVWQGLVQSANAHVMVNAHGMVPRGRERLHNCPFSQHWLVRTRPNSSHLSDQEWQGQRQTAFILVI